MLKIVPCNKHPPKLLSCRFYSLNLFIFYSKTVEDLLCTKYYVLGTGYTKILNRYHFVLKKQLDYCSY